MEVQEFKIKELKLIIPKRFSDARGYFQETWSDRVYRAVLGQVDFVQDNLSLSLRKALYGGYTSSTRLVLKVSWCGSGVDPSSMLRLISERDLQPMVST